VVHPYLKVCFFFTTFVVQFNDLDPDGAMVLEGTHNAV
jgi:hypothetical protein